MRKLVKLVMIDNVIPHDNADRLSIAQVGGWQCVIKKDQFQAGDLALYFEIDSMIPFEQNPHFEFLGKNNVLETRAVKYSRIKSTKLRGQISQGLLMPLDIFEKAEPLYHLFHQVSDKQLFVDTINHLSDFSSLFGVIKFEPPQPTRLVGNPKGNFPYFVKKTDQERYQNIKNQYISAKENDELFEVTAKLHGSSFTAFINKNADGEWYTGVCSRNFELKTDEDNNEFVKLFNKLELDKLMRAFVNDPESAFYNKPFAIQGEMCGPGINGNFEGLGQTELFVFDVFDISTGCYVKPDVRYRVVNSLGLKHVPIIDIKCALPNYENVQEYCTGPSALNGKFREGVVFKSYTRDFTFKAVSNRFLTGSTDFEDC